jgi:hypothetical protein
MLLPKHKHHATAILTTGFSFEIEGFSSPASHDAKLDPDLINSIRKGSQDAPRDITSDGAIFINCIMESATHPHVRGKRAGPSPVRFFARGCVIRV